MPQQAFASLMCSTIGVASKHSNTNKIDAENGVSKLSEAAKEERKKIVSTALFRSQCAVKFHLRMLMLPFKRMRMYDDYPIYHMRVSKKGDPSQIGNKYQRKEEL